MEVYKMIVTQKRALLEQLGMVTWKTRPTVTVYLTEIAKTVSETRFNNVIHSVVKSDMTPTEVVNYLRDIKI